MSADRQVTTWRRALEQLPELATLATSDVAEVLSEELERTLAAGETPDGEPWEPKTDGSDPLTRAQDRVTVQVVGKVALVTVEGPTARHHADRNGPAPKRQVIPTALGKAMIKKMRERVTDQFQAIIRSAQ